MSITTMRMSIGKEGFYVIDALSADAAEMQQEGWESYISEHGLIDEENVERF